MLWVYLASACTDIATLEPFYNLSVHPARPSWNSADHTMGIKHGAASFAVWSTTRLVDGPRERELGNDTLP